jgi:hypothetical protein
MRWRILWQFSSMSRKTMWLGLLWEKKDGRSEVRPCTWIQLTKRINHFIEYDITRDIDPATSNVKTFETLVQITVSDKHTLLRTKLEFMIIEWAKVWPTCTPKGAHAYIIWFLLENLLKGSGES